MGHGTLARSRRKSRHPARILAGASFLCVSAWAQAPVKLGIETDEFVLAGVPTAARIELRDSDNRPVTAARDWTVSYTVSTPAGEIEGRAVIARGAPSVEIDLPIDAAGITEVSAENPELLMSSELINVLPQDYDPEALSLPVPQALRVLRRSRASEDTSREEQAEDSGEAIREGEAASEAVDTSRFRRLAIPRDTVEARATAPPPSGPRGDDAPLQVELLARPSRTLLADGKDAWEVLAFVTGMPPVATRDVQLFLHASGGRLEPEQLTLSAGGHQAAALLTSSDIGDVTVSYVNSTPPVTVVGERTLSARFGPPITRLAVSASPASASLAGRIEIVAELQDENGVARDTDVDRSVSFGLSTDTVEFVGPSEAVLEAGRSRVSVEALPVRAGTVTVSASTANLVQASSEPITIDWPWLLLAVAMFGGAAGGYVASREEKKTVFPRMAVGLIVGTVLYCLALAGAVTFLVDARIGVANPLSGFAIAALGGWSGGKGFHAAAKRLGFLTV
jgi:hypothetical protein